MKTKTFKIGECCIGGIILVTISKTDIVIKALDWDTKEVVREYTFPKHFEGFGDQTGLHSMDNTLNQLTTCYYADKVLSYIKDNVTLN